MKSHANLWPRITSFENLYEAFRRARKGKRCRADVAAFEFDLESNLLTLQRELLTETYRPGGYRNFVVREPTERTISAAPFRDRVVHHALCRVIEPLFDRVFVPHSFANRTGKGTHRAMDRCRSLIGRYRYVLKADVSKFFPSVDHEILYALLVKRVRDAPASRLMRLILDSGAGVLADEYRMTWFPGDTLLGPLGRARGIPIGNLTSQFWANVYLHELDRFVVGSLGRDAYVRYVDDFLVFGDDKSKLHELRCRIEEFLATLRLTLHPRKTRVFPVTAGVPFLGFVHYRRHVRLKRDGVKRFVRRMRRYQRAFAEGGLPVPRLTASIQSWIAHASYGHTFRLRAALLSRCAFSPGP
ncbi:MAG: RNA-dependent DNA polymerase [Candidatus Rokubacteria bacterium]|nr:RNA-dependent DNA polymerase [Candidatus Rokubacteria bacterium]